MSHSEFLPENIRLDDSCFDDSRQAIIRNRLSGNVIKIFSNQYVILIVHALVFAAIYFLAFALRYDFDFFDNPFVYIIFLETLTWVLVLKLLVFYLNRHCHDVWYYATTKDLQQLIISSLTVMVLIYTIKTILFPTLVISRTVPLLDFILTVVVLGGFRLLLRTIHDDIRPRLTNHEMTTTLLVGANHLGARLAHNLHSYPEARYKILGFITIHHEKVRLRLGQIPVLGHIDDIQNVAKKYHASDILVIAGILNGFRMRKLIEQCKKANLNLKIVPKIENRLGNRDIPVRDINIDDLLKRDTIQLDDAIIRELIADRRVLVTGAGGSIGSEICRQLIRFCPENLMILGRGENRIFFLEKELKGMELTSQITPIIADVTNKARMTQVFEEYRPEVVFHAAAHKHVPLMEANVAEAIRNNIYGTKVVADLSDEYDVKTFVLVSTDKAVNPTSIMGTSKQMAERYVCAISKESVTQFVITRFGNVLGSAGSVVPVFSEQIQRGGPITVTDKRMTRFFMTIPEAAQLVLQAAAMGHGGEIFVLDMGEPVKIIDLARDMVRLAGLPEDAIEIQETGLRPGEKLYEELYFHSEKTITTEHPKLRAALHRPFYMDEVRFQVESLCSLLDAPPEEIRRCLREFVPEYKPFQEEANELSSTVTA